MLRRSPSDRTFAATAKLRNWRIHTMRTELPFVAGAAMSVSSHQLLKEKPKSSILSDFSGFPAFKASADQDDPT